MITIPKPLDLIDDLTKITNSFDGTIAIVFLDLDNDSNSFFYNENLQFHSASTFKVAVMLELFKKVKDREISLDDFLLVKNEFHSIVDCSIFSLDVKDENDDKLYSKLGQKVKIYDLVYDMITVSSNLATNVLLQIVEPEAITQTLRDYGIYNTKVLRGVGDLKAFEFGLNNITTADDLLKIFKLIAHKEIIDDFLCDEMIKILSEQKVRDKIPRYLPQNVVVAHKTGSISRVEHDSGIIFLPDGRKYVLVVLTKDFEDPNFAKNIIANISKVCYEYMVIN